MRLRTIIGVGARTWECGRGNTAGETRGGGKIQNEAVEWRREMGRKLDFNKFHWENDPDLRIQGSSRSHTREEIIERAGASESVRW